MANDMFIKVGDIKGESRVKGHEDEIDINGFDWGMSQTGSMTKGGGGGSGRVAINDLTFAKNVDKASPNLILSCCKGQQFPEAVLSVRKAGGAESIDYLTIILNDVIISSCATGGEENDELLKEKVSLNFASFKVEYQPQKEDGSKDGGAIPMGWDVKANASL